MAYGRVVHQKTKVIKSYKEKKVIKEIIILMTGGFFET